VIYKKRPASAIDTLQSEKTEKHDNDKNDKNDKVEKDTTDISNVLAHIKNLEHKSKELENQLETEKKRNAKLSEKTREGMQSALDTLMNKWMNAVETKDDSVKNNFKTGLKSLVDKSAEDNGVWQMMVAASSLHEKQEHDLDKLRGENQELRGRVDGLYATPESRTVGQKHRATNELSRADVIDENSGNIWDDFAQHINSMS
jgi:hypothetical protein